MSEISKFSELRKIDVSGIVEKKNGAVISVLGMGSRYIIA